MTTSYVNSIGYIDNSRIVLFSDDLRVIFLEYANDMSLYVMVGFNV